MLLTKLSIPRQIQFGLRCQSLLAKNQPELNSENIPKISSNELFSAEKERQKRNVAKINKIQVEVTGLAKGESANLVMNKFISTPGDCALHINESIKKHAAIALVNNEPWDMHRPLIDNCSLQYLYYTDSDPHHVNQAYWRTCSFVLGYVLKTAFKNGNKVTLHSWPGSDYTKGSFVYDTKLDVGNWTPTPAELKILSKIVIQDLRAANLNFEPLDVDVALASKIFENNPFKLEQLHSIRNHTNKVTLYRLGSHVDISKGPMIASTGHIGTYSVTAFHKFDSDFGELYRVQGVSVPHTQFVNAWTWELVGKAAKNMNLSPMPSRIRYELRK